MALNIIEPRRLPVAREYHAARRLTGGRMDNAALRTLCTCTIALAVIIGFIVLSWHEGAVNGPLAVLVGVVGTFYFTDPKQPAYGAPTQGEGPHGNA